MRSIRGHLDHLDRMVEQGRHTLSIRSQIDFVMQLVARLEESHANLEGEHAEEKAHHASAIAKRDATIVELWQRCAQLQQAINEANWTDLEQYAAAHRKAPQW